MISATANMGGSFPTIGISFPDDVAIETYTPSLFGSYRTLYVTGSSDVFGGTTGSIVISSHNTTENTVEGTFNCLDETHNVTDGTFSVEY